MKGDIILQFCGLHAKCYSIASASEQKQATAGVKSCQQKHLKHHHYVETLSDFTQKYITQRTIASHNHILYTQEQTRVGLSALDLKRIILPNGIEMVPYGFFK